MKQAFILWIAAFLVEKGFSVAAEPPDQITNSIGIRLKLIQAGSFTMGDAKLSSEQKPHCVTLTRPFYLGVYEVSNAQWQVVMGSVPSRWKDEDRPVESITWADAKEFCRKLSKLPEEKTTDRVYRLPTEAEWERACRAGTTTAYSFGDDKGGLHDHGWFDANSGGVDALRGPEEAKPVGSV